jgi:ATP-dependent Lon protease
MTDASTQQSPSMSGDKPATPDIPDDALCIVPLRNMVMFPGVMQSVTVGRPGSVAAIEVAVRSGRKVGLLLQKDPTQEDPSATDLYDIGTAASVLRYVTTPDGGHHLVCSGESRFRASEFVPGFPYLVARVTILPSAPGNDLEIEARLHYLKSRALEGLALLPHVRPDVAATIEGMTSAELLGDLVASFLDCEAAEKQALLATLDLTERLDKLIVLLGRRIEVLKITRDIERQTAASFSHRQREAVLREQVRQIQAELGEGGDATGEHAELARAIDTGGMPAEIAEHTRSELKRLTRMGETGTEASMQRAYIDWLIALPWAKLDPESIDIPSARKMLDQDHYGLEKVKRRILEFLAVRRLNPEGRSPILCLIGPPGVGKTSLGQSIAKAIGLKFVRASLGGVHDEAEIRGHRRTYVGALPGNIIQGLRKAGTRNPVFMLDEIDKLSASSHGDPSAALLEVLDPEQNATFRDTYLGVPFDLSKVLFIATANVLDTIPGPLRDRMELVELTGYTDEEKMEIAQRYLLPRQLAANGLTPEQISITKPALHGLIREYTREAGCRGLERQLGALLRHAAVAIAEGRITQAHIDSVELVEALGPGRFEDEVALRTAVTGVATGLAWTPVGGDILFIESTRVPGTGKLILTGQLGNVMKESAQATSSLVKSRASALGIDPGLLSAFDLHVHIPAGAVQKDGPSAGVAIYVSLVSLLTNRPVRHDVAMTGEISLRGLVLPVGGIKEKVLAAVRAGIRTVILPKRNSRDLEELPEAVRQEIRFVPVETVDEVVAAALLDVAIEPARTAA